MTEEEQNNLFGFLAGFESQEALLDGIKALQNTEHAPVLETFSPYPIQEVDTLLSRPRSRLPFAMFVGALVGAIGSYGMQYFAAVVNYPMNVGGRPLHSWPAFVPVTFELTVLCSALTGFLGLFIACGLPRLHHPVFDDPNFRRASQTSFFVLAHAPSNVDECDRLRRRLKSLHPESLSILHR